MLDGRRKGRGLLHAIQAMTDNKLMQNKLTSNQTGLEQQRGSNFQRKLGQKNGTIQTCTTGSSDEDQDLPIDFHGIYLHGGIYLEGGLFDEGLFVFVWVCF